jgi:disulfide bond formation protein DsbB
MPEWVLIAGITLVSALVGAVIGIEVYGEMVVQFMAESSETGGYVATVGGRMAEINEELHQEARENAGKSRAARAAHRSLEQLNTLRLAFLAVLAMILTLPGRGRD